MPTDTSVNTAVVEQVEEIKETPTIEQPKKRGRREGQKLFGHDKVYNTKEDCESNEPYYANEVEKKRTITKDGKQVEETYSDYEGEFEVEGFRVYKITNENDKSEAFCWARSGDMALANWAGQFATAELTDAKSKGRARKIDNIYLMFFKSMVMQKQIPQLLETLKSESLMHYLPLLGIDEEGNPAPVQTPATK